VAIRLARGCWATAFACLGASAISYEICQEIQRPKRAYPPHWCLLIPIFVKSITKLVLDFNLSTPYGFPQPGGRIGAMFSRVDGSMATASRSRRTDGHAVPAVLATWRCRKDQPKRFGGNTGNTGNPLPQSGAPDSSTISGASVYPPGGRFAPDGLAEMGGNRRKLLAENLLEKLSVFLLSHFRGPLQAPIGAALAEIAEIPPVWSQGYRISQFPSSRPRSPLDFARGKVRPE
jgi:hypothetical protein